SYAYSDSVTDVPMLETVGHPFAVNLDRALRRDALARSWPVLDFTHPAPLRRRLADRFDHVPKAPSRALVPAVAALGVTAVATTPFAATNGRSVAISACARPATTSAGTDDGAATRSPSAASRAGTSSASGAGKDAPDAVSRSAPSAGTSPAVRGRPSTASGTK